MQKFYRKRKSFDYEILLSSSCISVNFLFIFIVKVVFVLRYFAPLPNVSEQNIAYYFRVRVCAPINGWDISSHKPVIAILADHLLVPSSTDWWTDFMCPTWLFSSTLNTALAVEKIKAIISVLAEDVSLALAQLSRNSHSPYRANVATTIKSLRSIKDWLFEFIKSH